MFGRRKRIKPKQTMFLLQMDTNNGVWNLPETTMWLSFAEALSAATRSVKELIDAGEDIDWAELELDIHRQTAFLPFCFEIMPISVSTEEQITWMGETWTPVDWEEIKLI